MYRVFFIDRDNVWGYKNTIFGKNFVSKGILLHELHTFSFDNVRHGNFSNTDKNSLNTNSQKY